MREISIMAQGRGRLEWNQTSELLALIRNVNRGPKDKALTAEDFNPYAEKKEPAKPVLISKKEGFALLKALFIKGAK